MKREHTLTRAQRLTRLRMLANIHVYRVDPYSPARGIRLLRLASIVAAYYREVAQ